jgi:predicted transglutaminase-like cysteine proteinase
MHRRLLAALIATTAAAALPAAAHAGVALGTMPLALAAAASLEQGQCATLAYPAAGEARVASAALSKSAAILGGQVSQLELMRQQQAGLAAPAAPAALPGTGLVPRSGGECAMFVRPSTDFAAMRPGLGASVRGPDDFLASKRLAVSKTGFDRQWNRVRRGTLSASLTGAVKGSPGQTTIAAVNAWANAKIRYVEDRELYGQADYWADASTTLKRRAGDCEDIAIAKMALLAGAGVRREDMYLTIAHDLVRNADHAMLVVKSEGRYWLLDNNIDRLLDASEAYDYRPILSYSSTGKWLHGY